MTVEFFDALMYEAIESCEFNGVWLPVLVPVEFIGQAAEFIVWYKTIHGVSLMLDDWNDHYQLLSRA